MEEDKSKDEEDAIVVTHGSAGMSGLLTCSTCSFETYEYHYVLCLYIQLFGLFFFNISVV